VEFQRLVTGRSDEALADWHPEWPLAEHDSGRQPHASLYFATADTGFSEENAVLQRPLKGGRQHLRFELQAGHGPITALRCDPVDRPQWFIVHDIAIANGQHGLWRLSENASSATFLETQDVVALPEGLLRYAYSDDPKILLPSEALSGADELTIELDIELLDPGEVASKVNRLGVQLGEQRDMITDLREQTGNMERLMDELRERDARIIELQQQLISSANEVIRTQQGIVELQAQCQKLELELASTIGLLTASQRVVEEQESSLIDIRAELQKFEQQSQEIIEVRKQLDSVQWDLAERDTYISTIKQDLAESEQLRHDFSRLCEVLQLNECLAEDSLDPASQAVITLQESLVNLQRNLMEHEERVAGFEQQLATRDGQVIGLEQELASRDGRLAELERETLSHAERLKLMERELAERDRLVSAQAASLSEMQRSTSWRLTKPLRYVGLKQRKLKDILAVARNLRQRHSLAFMVRKASHILRNEGLAGVKARVRQQHVLAHGSLSAVFSTASSAVCALEAGNTALVSGRTTAEQSGLTDYPAGSISFPRIAESQYIRATSSPILEEMPVKVIAFYLPQFHEIEENNAWWGAGFTEWTNVKPAMPLYTGHYQPHVPDKVLGYYNLLDGNAQRKQIELAKNYGISGFCFYFYWFAGHRLLEQPILNYLNDRSLDLPFCLCWANENWSRRWDGLENEVLIGQEYSEEDDLAFISYISKYLNDDRYIQVDGKPLLIVYRPSLLPNAKSTVRRWRNWCRNNDIGEIFVGYTQSFESVDPAKYDFDAAIEFPPNNTAPPEITGSVVPVVDDFTGAVYDWSVYLERSASYKEPAYTLYRGVCPSWDNTARRKGNSISFLNSSPRGYQQWLLSASQDTIRRFSSPSERLVFVNAWNEWAEGAHLEPDEKYGFAWLEATRLALLRADIITNNQKTHGKTQKVAIVIHAFYDDVLAEILTYLHDLTVVPFKIFVSTVSEKYDAVSRLLDDYGFEYCLDVFENRGRDVLPFIRMAESVEREGFEYLIKVHTKRSPHRVDGDEWRSELYSKLLRNDAVIQALGIFKENLRIGVVGPDNHVVPMNFYWGSNAKAVQVLGERLGVSSVDLMNIDFVAGTMFMARLSALKPLLALGLDHDDFEPELGQVDGTLAHAIERAISISAYAVDMIVVSPSAQRVDLDYKFADPTLLERY
jgi:lipopolysaccharide biosynthesis protein